MDPRRDLTGPMAPGLPGNGLAALLAGVVLAAGPPAFAGAAASMAPIPNPPPRFGPQAIAAANHEARARSASDRFEGGLQVFEYGRGRIYEVWTAPLRVTALTLGPGESVTDLAAGDTVRWKIGETASGEGATRHPLILVKPLEAGLETNLVMTTARRTYLVLLRSGPAETFNAAVAWTPQAPPPAGTGPEPPAAPRGAPQAEALDAGYRIAPRGRRPRWTPTAVMTDGVRTYIAFPPALRQAEAPVLRSIAPDGSGRMVNYRQAGDVFIVDQVIGRAELRVDAGPRAAVVTLTRREDDHER